MCELKQLTPAQDPAAFELSGSCASPPDPNQLGWCYVEQAHAGPCPQAILFTSGEPPHGATVYLKCM